MTESDEGRLRAGVAPSSPRDYRIILPDGWFRIGLTPEQRDHNVDSLVQKQFKGIDNAPHIKEQLRSDLSRRSRKAYDKGGIELFLCLQALGEVTIPASLLVTLAPLTQPEELTPEELAGSLTQEALDSEVSLGELKSGAAVRVRSLTEPSKKDSANDYPASVTVDYYLPVPDSYAYLLLSFSTPLEPLADAMSELFDAVADSLTWVE